MNKEHWKSEEAGFLCGVPRKVLLVTFLFLVAILGNGVLRHVTNPGDYPLLGDMGGVPVPARTTFLHWGYWANPYQSLIRWDSLHYGDFEAVYLAAYRMRNEDKADLYLLEEVEGSRTFFVYVPIVALAVSPLAGPTSTVKNAADTVSYVNHAMWLIGGVLVFLIVTHRIPRKGMHVFWFLPLYLIYFPLASALFLTQASVWIYFFAVLGTFLLQRGHGFLAGMVMALAVSIKPHLAFALFFLFLLPRKEKPFLWGILAGITLVGGISLLYAGPRSIPGYLEVLRKASSGYAYFANQSLNGVLLRVFSNTKPVNFGLADPIPWIRMTGWIYGLGLMLAIWYFLRRISIHGKNPSSSLSFGLLWTAAALASPLCWYHHLSTLLIPFSLCLNYLWHHPESRSTARTILLASAYVLAGFFIDTRFLDNGLPGIFTGMAYYGGLLLLLIQILVLNNRKPEEKAG